MKRSIPLLLSVAFACILLAFIGCSDDDNELPAPTQEGLNTFGCLVNGEVWLPAGYHGTPNLDLSYDPGFRGGTFNLGAYRYFGDRESDVQYITIYGDSISTLTSYELRNPERQSAIFSDGTTHCYYDRDTSVYRRGILNITRLDLEQAIISGTFEFTLAKPNCDTIRVTEGRFDMEI